MNIKFQGKKLLFVFFLFFYIAGISAVEDSLKINSPFYFGEQENIYESINYLENEYLSFKFCTDINSKEIKFSLVCPEDSSSKELSIFPYSADKNPSGQVCYFSNYNLISSPCDDFSLEINYENLAKKKQLKRHFVKQKESQLINLVLGEDYEDLNPLEISYYLAVLNDVDNLNTDKSQKIYDELKNLRSNSDKCWPKNDCDVVDSSIILYNLFISDYSLDSRLIEDGKIFLEKNIMEDSEIKYPEFDFEEINYEFEINFYDDFPSEVDCVLEVDDESDRAYSFDDNDDYSDLVIKKRFEDKFTFSCDENLEEIRTKIFNERVYSYGYEDEDFVDYSLENSDLELYDTFNYEIKFENNFGSDLISCDVTIDSDTETYDFDENSTYDDLIIKGEFGESIEIDCDDQLDYIYLNIYGGEFEENVYSNKDEVSGEVEVTNKEESFGFDVFIDYTFEGSEDLICNLIIDSGKTRKYTFSKDEDLEILNKFASNKVSLSCDRNLDNLNLKIRDKFGNVQVDENYAAKSFAYTIPDDFSKYSCIGQDGECSLIASIFSIIIYSDEIEKSSEIKNFINSYIQEENGETFVNYEKDIFANSLYLLLEGNEDILNYIKFKQNNDGSWSEGSDTNKIKDTSFAVFGLEKDELDTKISSEHLLDGKKWIYYNEPSSGWSSVEKNSLAYLAIKEQIKPYIKISEVNFINDNFLFQIENPTVLSLKDVKVKFDDKSKDSLSYTENLGDIDAEQKVSFNISINKNLLSEMTGKLIVSGLNAKKQELELARIPINFKGSSDFKVVSEEKYFLVEGDSFLKLNLEGIPADKQLDCSYTNPFNGNSEKTLINSVVKDFSISNSDLKEGFYEGTLNCVGGESSYTLPFSFDVSVAKKSFNVSENSLVVTEDGSYSIVVSGIIPEKQTLTFEVEGDYLGIVYPLENSKIIAPNDVRDVFFNISNVALLSSMSSGSIIIKSSTGYYVKIPVEVEEGEISSGMAISKTYMIIGGIVFLLLGLILFRYIQLKRNEYQNSNYDDGSNSGNDDVYLDDMDFK